MKTTTIVLKNETLGVNYEIANVEAYNSIRNKMECPDHFEALVQTIAVLEVHLEDFITDYERSTNEEDKGITTSFIINERKAIEHLKSALRILEG